MTFGNIDSGFELGHFAKPAYSHAGSLSGLLKRTSQDSATGHGNANQASKQTSNAGILVPFFRFSVLLLRVSISTLAVLVCYVVLGFVR